MTYPIDIYISETNMMGEYFYRVMVEGKLYDHFFSKVQLTLSEQNDIVKGYQTAIENGL